MVDMCVWQHCLLNSVVFVWQEYRYTDYLSLTCSEHYLFNIYVTIITDFCGSTYACVYWQYANYVCVGPTQWQHPHGTLGIGYYIGWMFFLILHGWSINKSIYSVPLHVALNNDEFERLLFYSQVAFFNQLRILPERK